MTVPANVFARREPDSRGNVQLIKVTAVDEAYARTFSLTEPGRHYDMPVGEYDSRFIRTWRPATEEDMASLGSPDEGFRLPGNAPKSWGGEGDELIEPKRKR
jgi:hypothetical protein